MRRVLFLLSTLSLFSFGTFSKTQSPKILGLTFLQTTDVHHRVSGTGNFLSFNPYDGVDNYTTGKDLTQGGYARLATKIKNIKADQKKNNIPVLLVDSGDFLMGTPYDLLLKKAPGFRFFQEMNYDAITLGNHEFDYGPDTLANFIKGARRLGFISPIVATNMVTDGKGGTKDDDLENFKNQGIIKETLILKPYPNLTIGVLGLMGKDADRVAPLAKPVVFNHKIEFLQEKINYLKNVKGVNLVIALSHSGVSNPNSDNPMGDDIEIAKKVKGLDIIFSGHDHQKTERIITINKTRIVCAGHYGKNLARLDITFDLEKNNLSHLELKNYPIDDRISGDKKMNTIVKSYNKALNRILSKGSPGLSLQKPLGVAKFNISSPNFWRESGLGNLTSDAVRSVLAKKVKNPIGIVANGVIRDQVQKGVLSFHDLYSVLPLGITIAKDQPIMVPGSPLLYAYFETEDIEKLIWVALNLPPQLKSKAYYLNFSGIKYSYGWAIPGNPEFGYMANKIELVNPLTGAVTGDFATDGPYPMVFDLYLFLMMKKVDEELVKRGLPPLELQPLTPKGDPMNLEDPTHPNYFLNYRVDRDGNPENGIQEVKEWQALMEYVGVNKGIPNAYDMNSRSSKLKRVIPEL